MLTKQISFNILTNGTEKYLDEKHKNLTTFTNVRVKKGLTICHYFR